MNWKPFPLYLLARKAPVFPLSPPPSGPSVSTHDDLSPTADVTFFSPEKEKKSLCGLPPPPSAGLPAERMDREGGGELGRGFSPPLRWRSHGKVGVGWGGVATRDFPCKTE